MGVLRVLDSRSGQFFLFEEHSFPNERLNFPQSIRLDV